MNGDLASWHVCKAGDGFSEDCPFHPCQRRLAKEEGKAASVGLHGPDLELCCSDLTSFSEGNAVPLPRHEVPTNFQGLLPQDCEELSLSRSVF